MRSYRTAIDSIGVDCDNCSCSDRRTRVFTARVELDELKMSEDMSVHELVTHCETTCCKDPI